ncbi:hypothetical protein Z042_03985 [Chania multitudinisentens RB-25]|uniref:Type II secretion system protein GspB C-terminal domain-containing protein n=1 Tax=Chania multitudinisentens RB-25 TaxID=1441930 RepID=W0L9D7_9GAMM|nr:type II secretion system assembly factor GspB [Chania multitudinisentens]AHG18862.2 hypothetical protein Z042_03985 [Chania multitudinisentens RB-25]
MDNQTELTPKASVRPSNGLFIPGYLLPIYALLFIAFGWFAREHWHNSPALDRPAAMLSQAVPSAIAQTAPTPPAVVDPKVVNQPSKDTAVQENTDKEIPPGELASDELPALRYSAHVYASEDEKRSITLNGQRYHEGDSPAANLTIEQIQQDVTIFNFNGEVFTLDALEDWPGGKVDVANPSEK